jgi:hypothetical protein
MSAHDFDGREANMFFNFSFQTAGLIAASALIATLLSPTAAMAQTAPATSASQPSDPKDPPKIAYSAALGGYQRYVDQPVAPWVATNARVSEAGGWRAYAKQAQEPDASQSAPTKGKP